MPAGKGKANKDEATAEAPAPVVAVSPASGPEFPKYVKGYIFQSREAQDAAGPEYAD